MFNAQLLILASPEPGWQQLAVLLSERGYGVWGPCDLAKAEWPLEKIAGAELVLLGNTPLPPEKQGILPAACLQLDLVVALADPVAVFVQIEQALQARPADFTLGEARIRQLLEHLSDILVILGADGLPRYLSPAIERITGFTPTELMSKSALEIVHPEDQAHVFANMEWSRTHPGEPVMFEIRHAHKNGGYVLLESLGQSLLDVPGIEAFVVISRDISRRRQLESEIQDSEKRYRIVAEQTGQMIYDWDVTNGEIEWVGAIERITGFDTSAYQGVNIEVWESMIHEAERAATLAVLDQAARAEGHFSMEYRLQRKDGSFVWVEDTGLFLKDETGTVVRMLGSMKDISRRRVNAELLQSAFNEREILLQEIHHRVKNNFQIMISLLNMQIRRTPFVQVGESLKDVRSRLHSMLLVHEKLYNQGFTATVHFGEYLQVLSRELYAQHAGTVPVQLELALQPLVLRMDQAMPCGLIANELLTNAFKYAFPQAGERDCITLRLSEDGGEAQLDILDNGQGLPRDFRQGLGLHLVERLARQLDGTCGQVERPDGTHWVLRFPLAGV
jgi:PAS domain S-box-containing protein